jgi:hypothetical protein
MVENWMMVCSKSRSDGVMVEMIGKNKGSPVGTVFLKNGY